MVSSTHKTVPKDETHTEATALKLDETARSVLDRRVAHGAILIYFAADLVAWRHPAPKETNCLFLNQKLEEVSAKLLYLHNHYELRPRKPATVRKRK